jgi:hypothetical protein
MFQMQYAVRARRSNRGRPCGPAPVRGLAGQFRRSAAGVGPVPARAVRVRPDIGHRGVRGAVRPAWLGWRVTVAEIARARLADRPAARVAGGRRPEHRGPPLRRTRSQNRYWHWDGQWHLCRDRHRRGGLRCHRNRPRLQRRQARAAYPRLGARARLPIYSLALSAMSISHHPMAVRRSLFQQPPPFATMSRYRAGS